MLFPRSMLLFPRSILLFCVMVIRLAEMFFSFLQPLDLRQIT
ncbi:hypothetical protein RintRC_2725 [Richelia intracellularis]|nr:hypothetical protein RintRC_2725 [Richelia intracellularis]